MLRTFRNSNHPKKTDERTVKHRWIKDIEPTGSRLKTCRRKHTQELWALFLFFLTAWYIQCRGPTLQLWCHKSPPAWPRPGAVCNGRLEGIGDSEDGTLQEQRPWSCFTMLAVGQEKPNQNNQVLVLSIFPFTKKLLKGYPFSDPQPCGYAPKDENFGDWDFVHFVLLLWAFLLV